MIVMPANATGWLWHSMARETGRIGHLFSPGAQRGPFPWFPYALDNGAFSCWDMRANCFDHDKWATKEEEWRKLLIWAQFQDCKARWAIVPDVIGDGQATIHQWSKYAPTVQAANIPLAVAVQDGMTRDDVRSLFPRPDVIAVGGTTKWKWATVEMWARSFPRVHVLRCNAPQKLYELEAMGVESCDGTGWNRGDKTQARGLEEWARQKAIPTAHYLADYTCKKPKDKNQITFA